MRREQRERETKATTCGEAFLKEVEVEDLDLPLLSSSKKKLCQRQKKREREIKESHFRAISSLLPSLPADEPLRRFFSSGEGVALEKTSSLPTPSAESRPIRRRGVDRAGWSPPSRNDRVFSPARASDVSVACPTAARSSIGEIQKENSDWTASATTAEERKKCFFHKTKQKSFFFFFLLLSPFFLSA